MKKFEVLGHDVKEVQEKIFGIFLAFDELCRKHNISYTLEGGTLLGAVLYRDFIPWDDDMDIIMLRSEYEKFCSVASELPEPYVFEDMHSRPDYPFLFGKCYDTSTLYLEKATSHLDIQHGIFLDIFVEDNIHFKTKQLHSRAVAALGTVRYIKLGIEKFSPRHVLYLPLFLFSVQKLGLKAEKLMKKYSAEETDYIYPLCESISSKPPLPRRMLTQLQPGTFHGKQVLIPVCHMWYLHKHYETPMEIPPEKYQHPTHGVIDIKL
ncbi:MAG: LicD family protein [Clostridiales bacterium]|nr:LicD family protein [Clostridiales bacterium]